MKPTALRFGSSQKPVTTRIRGTAGGPRLLLVAFADSGEGRVLSITIHYCAARSSGRVYFAPLLRHECAVGPTNSSNLNERKQSETVQSIPPEIGGTNCSRGPHATGSNTSNGRCADGRLWWRSAPGWRPWSRWRHECQQLEEFWHQQHQEHEQWYLSLL